jgi:hypothetical protein
MESVPLGGSGTIRSTSRDGDPAVDGINFCGIPWLPAGLMVFCFILGCSAEPSKINQKFSCSLVTRQRTGGEIMSAQGSCGSRGKLALVFPRFVLFADARC